MEKTTSNDGTPIAFDRTGDGAPLVLVGGALNDRSSAKPLADALAPSLTVFTYDRRGRGDSGDTQPYAVEREVEDLDALISEAGRPVFVFGHSSGAALALEAASRGLAIKKLALYEPPFIVDDSRPPLPHDYVTTLKELTSAGRRGDAIEYFLTVGIGLPSDVVMQTRNAPVWQEMEALAHTLAYDGSIMGDHMSGKPLPIEWGASVTQPALLMDGGESQAWQRNAVRALADILPGSEHHTLEGQTHAAAPDVLAPVLETFLAR